MKSLSNMTMRPFFLNLFSSVQESLPPELPQINHVPEIIEEEQIEQPKKIKFPFLSEMSSDAFYGPIGECIHKIIPHTESSSEAILIQFLVTLGNIIGTKSYYTVESTKLYPNLFTVLVGESAWARKGTSWNHVTRLLRLPQDSDWDFQLVDDFWLENSIKSGVSSGEGILCQLKYLGKGDEEKKLTIIESEFASVLQKSKREGNVLSQIMRDAWDSKNISILTKSNPIHVNNPHLSFVGHITKAELLTSIKEVELYNGLANRILWVLSKRSKVLPFGGEIADVCFKQELHSIKNGLSTSGPIKLANESKDIWEDLYHSLGESKGNTLIDSIIARAPAQILKLSIIYSVVDGSPYILPSHLNAASSIWKYCENSVNTIFYDPSFDIAKNKIMDHMSQNQSEMTRTQISNLFGRNMKKNVIDAIRDQLLGEQIITVCKNGNREVWTFMK